MAFLSSFLSRPLDAMTDSANASLSGAGASAESPAVPQMVLLDWVFPGFSIFAGFVYKYLHIDLNLYIPLILLVGGLTVTFSYSSAYLWEQVEAYFMSAVDIRTDDEIYNILMAWVAAQKFAQSSRRFVVNTNLGSRSWFVMWNDRDDDGDDDDGAEGPRGSDSSTKKKKALNYTPSFGSHYFWYRGRLLMFRREANREGPRNMLASEKEEISISCFGRNPWILKELLHEARALYMAKDQNKTLIYRGALRSGSSEPYWQRCMARATRPFSTVILNEKTKANLITDVTDYLQPATQRWYSNRGIPYRRGYLLYGPPGTGKSSLSLALAGFFNMRIYIVSLSSMTASEENLGQLFNELPRRCVVLLEDIDSAGLTHTRANGGGGGGDNDGPEPLEPGQISPGTKDVEKNGRLSLSGLLNILDGVASQEGRVLIMTTNHLEKLDKALIRPGRVDMMVEFGLADAEMTAAIFRAIFAHLEGDEDDADAPPPPAGPERDLGAAERRRAREEARGAERAAEDARIDALAREFAARVPALEFSPAELQGHLMRHKRSPQAAVDAAEAFVQQTRKDHRNKEIQAAEDRRKAEEKRKEEQAKAARKAARRAAKKNKKSKTGDKSSGADSGSDAESSPSSSSSPASDESGSEAEASGKDKEKKKTKKRPKNDEKKKIKKKQPAKEEEEEENAAAAVAPATPPKSPEPMATTTTTMASVETEQADKHAKDSGYGTPASTEA